MEKYIPLIFLITSISMVSQESNYTPKMVAPNIISTAAFEGHASSTPSGNEFYFAIYANDHSYSTIAYAIRNNGIWSTPKIAPFSGNYSDGSPALSPDGNKLFFSSKRPIEGDSTNTDTDIWYVERTNENSTWEQPKRLSKNINSSYNEFSPSVDKQGNLYFCSNRPSGYGDMDVYYASFIKGQYQSPLLLPQTINSKYQEGNVGISPDGNTIFIMIQHKPGDYGYDDIHYSVKKNGKWVRSKNVGTIINTPTYDFSPKVSPNGKTLYFSSRIHSGFTKTKTKYTYTSLMNRLNSPLNGLGNIYTIDLKKLDINTQE